MNNPLTNIVQDWIQPSSNVIDFGCGDGSLLQELREHKQTIGYGIEIDHDSLKWNDYNGLDVEGKLVMVLRGDPEPDDDSSLFISYGNDRDKVLSAKDRNAVGIIFVNGKNSSLEDNLVKNTSDRVTASAGLPAINITRAMADSIIGNGNSILDIENEIIIKKKIKNFLSEDKANITIRNFPKTVNQIRKETKIKDGGNSYLFFTTLKNNELVVICCKKTG